MFLGSIASDILDTIQNGIFWLLLKLDAIVYSFIDWIYQIILMLANGDILGNTNLVDELINRLYLIIGVIILFLVAYSLLRSMVNPDEILKGKESPIKIIQNVIISVVLIAVIPYIFTFAMDFQNSLLKQNTIGRLILGEGNSENASSNTVDDGGFNIAINVFQAFFQPNTNAGYCTGNTSIDQNYPDCEELTDKVGDTGLDYYSWWQEKIINNKNLFALSEANTLVAQNKISYTFIISTIAGAFVVFVLVSYCIDIAIRLVKLAVFQLIAPLPILARIIPKEDTKKIFSNWLKATISTYVEVFIRLGILFFAVFIIDLVVSNFNTIFDTMGNLENVNPILVLIAQALVILGIILFVKQLPQIIKDITGLDGGKYNVFGSAMKGLSTIGALGTGTVRGFTTGFDKEHIPSSVGRGLKNAFSSGAKSFVGASQKEYKSLKDIKGNAHASVEEVINRQRQRQAEKAAKKRDLESYQTMPQGEHEPDFIYKVRQNKIGSAILKNAKDTTAGIKEWAGVSGSDPTTDNRTKEAINAIGSLVGSMQDVWKKDPGFIKAKEEANNAEALYNAVNKDYQEMLERGVSVTDAEQQIIQKYQMSKNEAQRRMDVAKSVQKSQ